VHDRVRFSLLSRARAASEKMNTIQAENATAILTIACRRAAINRDRRGGFRKPLLHRLSAIAIFPSRPSPPAELLSFAAQLAATAGECHCDEFDEYRVEFLSRDERNEIAIAMKGEKLHPRRRGLIFGAFSARRGIQRCEQRYTSSSSCRFVRLKPRLEAD